MGCIRSAFGIIFILLMIWAQKIQSPAVNIHPESNKCVLGTHRGVDIRVTLKPSMNATCENLQLSATFLNQQWTSANSVLNGTAELLWDIFDKLHRIPFENALYYHWNLIWPYFDCATQKIGTQRADSDIRVAVVWIVFCALIVFPVLVNWRLTSLRNPDDVQKMNDIDMLDNDNENNMVNNTSYVIFWQDTFLRRFPARISLIGSQFTLAMEIAYNNDDVTLLRLIISKPFGTARSNNHREVLLPDGANSYCDVTSLSQRKPDFRSYSTSRVLPLVQGSINGEHDRFPPPQHFFLPLTTDSENFQHNEDHALVGFIGSAKNPLSVTDQVTKSRVARIHTREPKPGLEHASQERSEGGNGTDLDEAYNIYMAQKFSTPKVSLKDKNIKQLMKKFIADIDEVYGPPSQLVVSLFGKELSGKKKGTYPGKSCNGSVTPKRCSPKESQKERDLKQSLKNFIAGIDETYGPPSQPPAKNLYKAFNVSMAPGRFASKMFPNDKNLKQLMKHFIADIDETYGSPTQPVSHNLYKTFKVSMAPRNYASKVSQKDKELKKLMKNFIADIDETYGPPSQPVAKNSNKTFQVSMAPRRCASKTSQKEKELKQLMKNFNANVDETYGPPSKPVDKNLYKIFQASMTPRRCASKTSQKEKELKQLMKNFIANIDETYGPTRQSAVYVFREELSEQGKGTYPEEVRNVSIAQHDSQQTLKEFVDDIEERKVRTPRRRLTDFLWGCQEVMCYVLQVYRDQPI